MKKSKGPKTDEVRPEYDFASMSGGVRGKYVIVLEPDAFVGSDTRGALSSSDLRSGPAA